MLRLFFIDSTVDVDVAIVNSQQCRALWHAPYPGID